MEQSPTWEANRSLTGQEIQRIVWNPKVHHHIQMHPTPFPIMSQINPFYVSLSQFLNINFNIILPSTPWSYKWSLSLRSPHSSNDAILLLNSSPGTQGVGGVEVSKRQSIGSAWMFSVLTTYQGKNRKPKRAQLDAILKRHLFKTQRRHIVFFKFHSGAIAHFSVSTQRCHLVFEFLTGDYCPFLSFGAHWTPFSNFEPGVLPIDRLYLTYYTDAAILFLSLGPGLLPIFEFWGPLHPLHPHFLNFGPGGIAHGRAKRVIVLLLCMHISCRPYLPHILLITFVLVWSPS